MIELKGVHKSFGDLEVLKGIDLNVQKGEVLSVIGGSGSGKSTMLYCINAIENIQGGEILVDGISVHDKKTDKNKLRQKIGMVFQQWNSFPHLTVLENVMLAPMKVLGMSYEEAHYVAKDQLERVGLRTKLDEYPTRMSGGQQQRLAIARALAMKAEYMLFDEITSALDPELVGEVLDTLRLLRDEGMTMICVTHEIAFAREVSDRIAFFHKGLIEEIGTPEQVIGNPQKERTQQFLSKVLH
ncbi:amino acid ABC transporter ATP-binding protein [Halarcobacter sp.]|uniref:amino acid ABC transporter ATP-binding protein n=1 Tax=Halarcobacter sp. TaxID=2321133 RepID=UPI0029F4E880|nr:amino acid ABC transporter ATP-binding protein [Halarcobacter sp.]